MEDLLPFHEHLLVPFILAWRASPATLSDEARSVIVSEQLSAWGYTLIPHDVLTSHAALSMAFPLDMEFSASPDSFD